MNKQDKIAYLQENHWADWHNTRIEADALVSRQHAMFCVCGKLCTGLHERTCSRFKAKVDTQTIKMLKHLLPKKG